MEKFSEDWKKKDARRLSHVLPALMCYRQQYWAIGRRGFVGGVHVVNLGC
jgi:hypothetical protein